ncbi:MAG: DsbA family protein [Enterococcus aquimarinus]|nr:DsbA family protein [Streptococcus sp.]MBP9623731.1 DsbA family protein [Streptococcus sp.]
MEKKLIITEFTDPVCTWCWGSEPVLRKLQTVYQDQLDVRFIMGGLVPDISDFMDAANQIGGNPEDSNKQVAKHWLEASERHGMPVKVDDFNLFSAEYPSTYPQNIAYKAAQIQDQKLADKFLRRMREASTAEGRLISHLDVQIELASEVGLSVSDFIVNMKNGEAERAFKDDLAITQSLKVRGFPTFLVEYGEKSVMMRGFNRFEDFMAVTKDYLNATDLETFDIIKDEAHILNFIQKFERVTPKEISETFDLTDKEYNKMMTSLADQGKIVQIEAGNGFFIEPSTNALNCDTETGVCSI